MAGFEADDERRFGFGEGIRDFEAGECPSDGRGLVLERKYERKLGVRDTTGSRVEPETWTGVSSGELSRCLVLKGDDLRIDFGFSIDKAEELFEDCLLSSLAISSPRRLDPIFFFTDLSVTRTNGQPVDRHYLWAFLNIRGHDRSPTKDLAMSELRHAWVTGAGRQYVYHA